MSEYLKRLFSFEGRMRPGEYAGVLLVLSAPALALAYAGSAEGSAGLASALVYPALMWIFLATLAKRIKDAGRTRLWILLPVALGLVTFFGAFWFFQPVDPVTGGENAGRSATTISIVPLILGFAAMVAVKAGYGLKTTAFLWGIFSLVVLLLPSRPRDSA